MALRAPGCAGSHPGGRGGSGEESETGAQGAQVGGGHSLTSSAPQLARRASLCSHVSTHSPRPSWDRAPQVRPPFFCPMRDVRHMWGQPRALGTPAHPMTSSPPPLQTSLLLEIRRGAHLPARPRPLAAPHLPGRDVLLQGHEAGHVVLLAGEGSEPGPRPSAPIPLLPWASPGG